MMNKGSGKSHTVAVRTRLDLTSEEANILLHKGRVLFSLLQHTNDSIKYLEFHPDLKKVIEKW